MNDQTNVAGVAGIPLAGEGGWGESVRSGTSGGGRGVQIPPPPQNGEGQSIASTLTLLGVFCLAPAKQRATACALAGAGIESQQLLDLAAFLSESEADAGKVRKYLAAVLVGVDRAKEALRGLAEHRDAAAKLAAAKPVADGPPHMFNMPLGSPTCSCAPCVASRANADPAEPMDHDRRCRVAWCRVHGDKRPVADVAAEMGVSELALGAMLDRGRMLSEPRPELVGAGGSMRKAERDAKAERDRVQKFAKASRPERLQLLRGEV